MVPATFFRSTTNIVGASPTGRLLFSKSISSSFLPSNSRALTTMSSPTISTSSYYSTSVASTSSMASHPSSATSAYSTSATRSPSSYKPVLSKSSINPHVINVEYAVRGEISNKANNYAKLLSEGKKESAGIKFDSVVTANIGNPQQQPYLAQKPLTFWRQVAALTELPYLMEHESTRAVFPEDTIQRAKALLADVGSVGAYSHSKGSALVRKHVAEFIQERDGYPVDPELIYLTTGASGGVQLLMQVMVAGPDSGVMIPIPQYPLYSAALSLYNAQPVEYQLNPFDDWSLDVQAMSKSIDEARGKGVDVRACVVINPGNPTGQCLSEDNIKDLIRMAHEKRVVLLADEVYQANIFQPETRPFHSFRKVLKDFSKSQNAEEASMADEVELISFHSISKGVSGECGRRGGYFELCNISPEVEAEIYKLASISLCPSLQGQIGVDMLVKPPKKGEPSYPLYKAETEAIHKTLLQRSEKMAERLDKLKGVSVDPAQGALYLFPRLELGSKAVAEAEKRGKKVDNFYCLEMLDATGICVVPGSGFGKMPDEETGECWFRTTILAKETDEFIERYGKFHDEFMKMYGGDL